jgi:UDP-3-O-[3-hydroxymyristoyl] glucosamine N-acyltransferase
MVCSNSREGGSNIYSINNRSDMAEKQISVARLAEMVRGRVVGEPDRLITGFDSLENASSSEITFLADIKNMSSLQSCRAGCVIVPEGLREGEVSSAIVVKDPYLAVAVIHGFFVREKFEPKGIHARAHVDESCVTGTEVTVGPMAVIGERTILGERVLVGPGAVIGDDVTIGDDTTICANATIYNGSRIGSRVTIHSGAVIGCDGYGYSTNERGEHLKRPQVGIVCIEDDVEIGANTCIDRAAYGVTLVRAGSKIDNLVQIGHNVVVGENSLIVSQVGISGSTSLGRNVVIGGQAGIAGHISLGDRVMIAAKSGIHKDIGDGEMVGGIPAIPARQWAKCSAVYSRLPELNARVRKNTKLIEKLELGLGDSTSKGDRDD